MRGALRWGLGALFVLLGVWLFATIGLALFRRDYARRVARLALVPDVELAFGAPWLVLVRTAAFVVRHPSTLRWGLLYGAHLLIGVDLLAAVDDEELLRLHRSISGR